MTPALIAAVKVCFLVGTQVCFADTCTVGSNVGVRWSFPAGYEQCQALIAEQDREWAEEVAGPTTSVKDALHAIYQAGIRDLQEGKGK